MAKIEALLNDLPNIKGAHEPLFIANQTLLYFRCGDYHKALANINFILNDVNIQLSPENYNSLRILHLMIHFDKGNIELLTYLLKSLYRYLKNKKQLYQAENIFLKFITNNLSSINHSRNQIEDFNSLREELLKISNDPFEAGFLEFLDIISWLESKIENRPFAEILQEKSGYLIEICRAKLSP